MSLMQQFLAEEAETTFLDLNLRNCDVRYYLSFEQQFDTYVYYRLLVVPEIQLGPCFKCQKPFGVSRDTIYWKFDWYMRCVYTRDDACCPYCCKSFSCMKNKIRHIAVCPERRLAYELKVKEVENAFLQFRTLLADTIVESARLRAKLLQKEAFIEQKAKLASCKRVIRAETQPNTNTDDDGSGFLYIIREREFVRLDKPVYKFGKAKNFQNRLKRYPNNSEVLATVAVSNRHLAENELKDCFQLKFQQEREYGYEYFSGDRQMMLDEFFRVALQYAYTGPQTAESDATQSTVTC